MSNTKPSDKQTTDISTLLAQHGWRVAIMVGCLSLAIRSTYFYGSLLAVLICLYWLQKELFTANQRRHLPPGELGLPILGETLSLLFHPALYAKNKALKYGHAYTESSLFGMGVVFGRDTDISWLWNAERKRQVRGTWPLHIRALLGRGAVANTHGKRHQMLRHLLEPAFAPQATKDYVDILDVATQASLQEWSSCCSTSSSSSVDCSDEGNDKQQESWHSSAEFKLYALRLFLLASFGHVDEDVMDQLHDDFSIWISGFGSLVPLRMLPGTVFYRAMNARDRILTTVEDLIELFKAENPPDSIRGQKSMMGRVCYGTDKDGNPIELEDLKDNILNMIFAGHDTTYASMGTALHYLSQQPVVAQALADEVKTFQEPLDFDELKNAPVLNAFMAECWRMDPPVGGGFRKLEQDMPYKGWALPKDMIVRYNILSQCQNESVYPTPDTFEIQRFLPDDHALKQDASLEAKGVNYNNLKANYPVFGGGAHSCLGSHFAKLEMRVLLTRLLQSYELQVRKSEKVHFPVNGWKNEFKLVAK